VIRTRMFVSMLKDSEAVARAHAEFFGAMRPTTSVVQADSLAPDTLVEVEAEAVLG
jgi:enamine deaminase RidA (YjgF/YER057c/UK114 family)